MADSRTSSDGASRAWRPRESGPGSRLLGWMHVGPFLVAHKRYAPGFRQGLHEHAIAAMDLNVQGGGQGRYHRVERASRAGEVEYFHAGVPHSFVAGPRGIRTLHVSFDPMVGPDLGVRPCEDARPEQAGATGAAARILRELADPDASSALVIEESALAMLHATFRLEPGDSAPGWLGRVREALHAAAEHEAPGERFSLASLAAQVGVDRAHLARSFKLHTGMTCGQYHRRVRIAAAQRMIADGRTPLTRIAHTTGFADQAHLTRWFRRDTGWTPAAFARCLR